MASRFVSKGKKIYIFYTMNVLLAWLVLQKSGAMNNIQQSRGQFSSESVTQVTMMLLCKGHAV